MDSKVGDDRLVWESARSNELFNYAATGGNFSVIDTRYLTSHIHNARYYTGRCSLSLLNQIIARAYPPIIEKASKLLCRTLLPTAPPWKVIGDEVGVVDDVVVFAVELLGAGMKIPPAMAGGDLDVVFLAAVW